jgi:hypothetical protein
VWVGGWWCVARSSESLWERGMQANSEQSSHKLRRSLHAIASCCAMCEHPHGQKIILLCTPHTPLPSAWDVSACRTLSAFCPHPNHRVNSGSLFWRALAVQLANLLLQPVRPRCNDCNVTTSQHRTLDSVCRSACAWRSNAHAAQLKYVVLLQSLLWSLP